MAKPTSLAAHLKRDDEATKLAAEKEDKAILGTPAEPGKVWVRLLRPHYDVNNVLHLPGVVQLEAGLVPQSARILSQAEAAVEAEDESEE